MKQFTKTLNQWLLVLGFLAVATPVQLCAQISEVEEASETAPADPVVDTSDTNSQFDEEAEPENNIVSDDEAAKSDAPAEVDDSRRRPTRWGRNQGEPFVGVFNDVVVEEGEVADMVVAVVADYTIRGRSSSEAVTVLGNGEVSGPVDGDCVTVLGSVEINSPIDGDVVIVCSEAYINAPIEGDVVLVLSNVEFGPNARIEGETVIVGPQPTTDPGAVFNGPKQKVHLPSMAWLAEYVRSALLLGRVIAPGIAWVWYIVLFFFVFRLLILLVFPRPIHAGVDVMRESSIRTFLIGVIAYILYLPALALLGATVVGGIAVPFVALAWEVATLLGKIAVLVLLGNHLGRQLKLQTLETPVGGFIAGTALITLIYMVPILGILVHLLIKPLALGSMLVAAIDAFQRERRPPVIPPIGTPPPSPSPTHKANTTSAPNAAQSIPTGDAVPPVIGAAPSPAPTPEELSTYQRVGFWPRFGASVLDFILVMISVAALLQRAEYFPLVWIAYHLAMWAWRGTTLGGIVFSLRIVRLDGRRFDFVTAVVRFIGAVLSLLVAGLGFFWASWNPDKQSWHDMIAGTIIVKTPRATPLV